MRTSYQTGQVIQSTLTGNEFISIDTGGSVDVKTTTADVAGLAFGAPAAFGSAFTAWIEANPAEFWALFSAAMNTLPATVIGQSAGQMINSGGVIEQVQS